LLAQDCESPNTEQHAEGTLLLELLSRLRSVFHEVESSAHKVYDDVAPFIGHVSPSPTAAEQTLRPNEQPGDLNCEARLLRLQAELNASNQQDGQLRDSVLRHEHVQKEILRLRAQEQQRELWMLRQWQQDVSEMEAELLAKDAEIERLRETLSLPDHTRLLSVGADTPKLVSARILPAAAMHTSPKRASIR